MPNAKLCLYMKGGEDNEYMDLKVLPNARVRAN